MQKHWLFENGFSLIELIISISILGILLTLAAPSFISTVQRNQLSSSVSELHSILSLSRSEAIKRASYTTLCASSDLMNCSDSMSWSNGWILFMDNDGDGIFEDDGDAVLCEINEDCLLKLSDSLSINVVLTANVSFITFDLNGLPIATANYTASITSCSNDTKIIVNTTGRSHVQSDC